MMQMSSQAQRALRACEAFYRTDLNGVLKHVAPELRSAGLVQFFHSVATEVPAYASFLSEHGVEANSVRSFQEFRTLPATSKENYHQRYPLAALCRHGRIEECDFIAMSSGSTGRPTAWPRFVADELGTAMRFEQVLLDSFAARQRRTLGVVCFNLGSWVGGMFTTAACRHVAAKGYPLTLVTPGSNIPEILRVLRALAPAFEQVVLFGYPPFLKDVIDGGKADGFDWKALRVGIVTAGEVFSEAWRDLVCERLGARDPSLASASLYGTADGGVLANETPLSIRIRRFLAERPSLARELFGEARLPTFCQFDPLHRAFEEVAGDLLFTGDGGVPLVRYSILDRGGICEYSNLMARLRDCGFGAGGDIPHRPLPFVFVFGRSGFAVSIYGANVYPENVVLGLEQTEIAPHVTGKFVMSVVETQQLESEFQVVVELAAGIEPSEELESRVARSVRAQLERVNSEYLNYVPEAKRTPVVRLLPLGTPEYFPPGVKHRYTR
jgi:phenylacetate-CoA ligase